MKMKLKTFLSLKVLAVMLGLIGYNSLYAQCIQGSSSGTITPLVTWQTVNVTAGPVYYLDFVATAGVNYTFTYCQGGGQYSGDPYLTITNGVPTALAFNDDYCGLGSNIFWSCNASGPHRIYFSSCCPCGAGAPNNSILAYRADQNPVVATPCAGTPSLNTILPASFTTCPSYTNPAMNLVTNYSLSGLTVTWQSSTISLVGPWSTLTGPTVYDYNNLGANAYNTPTVGVTTWYQAVVTCTNSNQSVTVPGPSIYVAPATTNVVTYNESFEGIPFNFRLPNCSWNVSNMNACRTYTSSQANNRTARTGNKYATFTSTVSGTHYYYSNGIWMDAGVTYSASMWYQTDLNLGTNFSNLEISYGTSQTPNGLTSIALQAGSVVSPIYKSLSNTFTVPTSGLYYIAVDVSSTPGSAQFLTWDDLNVMVPCDVASNQPNLQVSSASVICSGAALNLTASGANSYTWSTGSNSASIVQYPTTPMSYSVTGTNTLTGCTATAVRNVLVNPSPNITMIATPGMACPGTSVTMQASGAGTYIWSTGGNGPVVTITPSATVVYSVTGTLNGCATTQTLSLMVYNSPTVSASSSRNSMCVNENVTLIGSGAQSYQWMASNTSVLYQGSPISIMPTVAGPASYTVTGTDANGCTAKAVVNVNVEACTGISQLGASAIELYPNPNKGDFYVKSTDKSVFGVEVIDVTGKVVWNSTSQSSEIHVSMKDRAAGVYYVRIHKGQELKVVKMVKE